MDYVLNSHPIYEPHDRMGLRKKKNFSYVIDLDRCHLIPIDKFVMLRKVFLKALELAIPLYDLKTGEGILRYLVIRTSKKDTMLNIVVKDAADMEKISNLMKYAKTLGFTTVYLIEQPEPSDTSNGTVISRIGKEHMEIWIDLDKRYMFKIGPNNFFQNNIQGFEVHMPT
jgi:tRNA/tmRNA/rRNA uracil-C5-methylase (TrmA/RlmC/RlmD family)